MTMTGFRGTVGGSVQSNYTDQPGRAVAGMLAFASEEAVANIDSYVVNETNGVLAGRVVVGAYNTASAYNLQTPDLAVSLPSTGKTVSDVAGIVLYDEAMQSDTDGNPGWADGRFARVLRPKRSGGRVWVRVTDTIAVTNTVYLCTVADTAGQYAPGDLTNQNTAAGGTFTTLATIAKFITPATGTAEAPALAMVEFGLV